MIYEIPLAMLVVSMVMDGVVVLCLLFGQQWLIRAGIRIVGFQLWAALGLACYVVGKLFLLQVLGVKLFGLIKLSYADAVVLAPLIGVLVIVGSWLPPLRWHFSRIVRTAAWLSLGLIPVGIYATCIEPFRLQLETARVTIPDDRTGSSPIRIGILSDVQTNLVTDHERSAVDLLMAQKPDVILLTGDLFQGSRSQFVNQFSPLRSLLERLRAPGGVYFVLGDTDHPGSEFLDLLQSAGIRLLVNEVAHVSVGDRNLTIAGSELDHASPRVSAFVREVEKTENPGDIRILAAHRPDVAFALRPHSRIDLVAAGHTHGGQIVVPWFGPPMTLSSVPRTVAAGGLHAIGGNPIYVSRGVGCERGQAPRIRFLCPPEVSLLVLEGKPRR